ncbi:MAG: hypothetical protein QM783_06215 [Phycisphaerales bacterium]
MGRSRLVVGLCADGGDPVADGLEIGGDEFVEALAALLFDRDETSVFKLAEVAGDRGPGVLEAVGDEAGGHRAAPRVEHQEDAAARGVCEGVKGEVERGGVRGGLVFTRRHASDHWRCAPELHVVAEGAHRLPDRHDDR